MKNNSKNRKLKFIRQKNDLRLGKTKFYCTEKVSSEVDILTADYWERLTTIAINSLKRRYNLKLNVVTFMPNQIDGDDFIRNVKTNAVILSRN